MFLTAWKTTATTILLLLTLSGCTSIGGLFGGKQEPREIEIKTVEIRIPIQQPVMPRPIDMKEPKWYVVSPKNMDEFLKRIQKQSGGVFFAMTPAGYELMAYNLQEIKRFVKETKEVIVYYRTVTLPDEELETQRSEETTPKRESLIDQFRNRIKPDDGNGKQD